MMSEQLTYPLGDSPDKLRRRITVMVGYSWGRDERKRLLSPRNDGRWQGIKAKVQAEAGAVETYAGKRKPASQKLEISIERLRGTHGDMLLSNVLGRIRKADILIFDIGSTLGSGYNPNVLLEVGMALTLDRHNQGRLFILKPESLPTPSDLLGFLFTEYISEDRAFKLVDDPGFRAALRSSLMELARERGMIGDLKSPAVEVDLVDSSVTQVDPPTEQKRRVSKKK